MIDRALVIMHGVGASKPGVMLRQIAGDLAGPVDTVDIDGFAVPFLRARQHDQIIAIYECYYADLKPGATERLGWLVYPIRILLVLSQLGARGWVGDHGGAGAPLLAGRALHYFLWVFVFAAPTMLFTLLHVTFERTALLLWAQVALAIMPTITVCVTLRRVDRCLLLTLVLSLLGAIAVLAAAAAGLLNSPRNADFAGRFVSWLQLVAAVLILSSFVELCLRCALHWIQGNPIRATAGWYAPPPCFCPLRCLGERSAP